MEEDFKMFRDSVQNKSESQSQSLPNSKSVTPKSPTKALKSKTVSYLPKNSQTFEDKVMRSPVINSKKSNGNGNKSPSERHSPVEKADIHPIDKRKSINEDNDPNSEYFLVESISAHKSGNKNVFKEKDEVNDDEFELIEEEDSPLKKNLNFEQNKMVGKD